MNHPTPLPFAFRSPSFRMGRSGGFPSRSRRLGGGGGGGRQPGRGAIAAAAGGGRGG